MTAKIEISNVLPLFSQLYEEFSDEEVKKIIESAYTESMNKEEIAEDVIAKIYNNLIQYLSLYKIKRSEKATKLLKQLHDLQSHANNSKNTWNPWPISFGVF